jgi:phospholipid/cholesterol/gamma-HCH transport system substrate-binding protein
VVGVLVLLVLVFLFGGGRRLFAKAYEIKVHFPEGVVGVESGQSVTLHGKRVGETTDVRFYTDQKTHEEHPEEGVNVIVAIDEEFDIPKSAHIRVASSIMGFGRPAICLIIDHTQRQPEMLPRDGTGEITGTMVEILDQVLPPPMQETLTSATKSLDELARALTPVAENLARLLESRDVEQVDLQQLTANLDTVIQRFDATLRNINTVIGDEENIRNLGTLLANASAISEDGKQTIKNVDAMVKGLKRNTDELSAVLTQLDRTLASIDEGKGTLSLLLKDNRLYEEMVLSARRMTKALDELREVLEIMKQGNLRLRAF